MQHQKTLLDAGEGATGYLAKYAELSDDGRFRWLLGRSWGAAPGVLFVMLNPSTADSNYDDPTIRRCREFAKREGAGSMEICNLIPWRSTNPRDLLGTWQHWQKPAIASENLRRISTAAQKASVVVCAWGAFVDTVAKKCGAWPHRDVLAALKAIPGLLVAHLGLTASGQPRHPLYTPGDARLVAWPLE